MGEVTIQCDNCGKEIKRESSQLERSENLFCSKECYGNFKSEKVERTCKTCGDPFKVSPSTLKNRPALYCSRECRPKSRENNPFFGKTHDKEARKKMSIIAKKRTGKDNPAWKGGKQKYYGENWKEMRRKTLNRDNKKCVICKRGKEELGTDPSVHHIVPIKNFDTPENANYLDNLITVCRKHHSMIEGWGLKPDTR